MLVILTRSRAQYIELPVEMQRRMPTSYANALKLPLAVGLRGHDLYQTVMNAALSFKLNYGMTFPEMNCFPMLVQYTKELALPGKFGLCSAPTGARNLTINF